MNDLNREVIKIYLEDKLVRYHGFTLHNDIVEKSALGRKFMLQLKLSALELVDDQGHILGSFGIADDIKAEDCISLARQFYARFSQLMREEGL